MLTDEQLHKIMPALPRARRLAMLPFLHAAMREFAIDRAARVAAFVAQLAHESGELRFMEEIWGPTGAQRRYEPHATLATKLGNTEPGDGKRFKGRGPIQITGRANYRRFGRLLDVDLESHPSQAATPELGFRIAGLFWQKNGLNKLADRASSEAFREITERINGGVNGLKDRQRYYSVARTVLGVIETGETGHAMPVGPRRKFERGHEAVRALGRRRPTRDASPTRKRTRPRSRRRRP